MRDDSSWTPEIDESCRLAVRAIMPDDCFDLFDDAFQEARLAILEAETGHAAAWYVQRGVWAAKKWLRKEHKADHPMDMTEKEIFYGGGR